MKQQHLERRRGVTLLELLVVVTLLGILTSVAMMRVGRSLFADFGAQAAARQVALALLEAQRGAITTGDNHFVAFDTANPRIYRLFRREGSEDALVDGPRDLGEDITVAVSHHAMEFTFEGQALEPYTLSLVGRNRSWSVNVIPINGSVRTVETTR